MALSKLEFALFSAAYNGRTEAVKALISQPNIDVNAQNEDGITALILAAFHGHTEVVKALISQPNIDVNAQDKDGDTALMLANTKGYTEIHGLLLDLAGGDITQGYEPWIRLGLVFEGATQRHKPPAP